MCEQEDPRSRVVTGLFELTSNLVDAKERIAELEAEVAIHEDALAILANCHIVESYEGRAETEIAKAIKVAREEWEKAHDAGQEAKENVKETNRVGTVLPMPEYGCEVCDIVDPYPKRCFACMCKYVAELERAFSLAVESNIESEHNGDQEMIAICIPKRMEMWLRKAREEFADAHALSKAHELAREAKGEATDDKRD